MSSFPLKARRRSNANDQPKPTIVQETVGIFDNRGYWANLSPLGVIELPVSFEPLAQKIAAMANAAYEQGQEDARAAIREALGIEE